VAGRTARGELVLRMVLGSDWGFASVLVSCCVRTTHSPATVNLAQVN
jgi:hypothetical protein